MHRASPLTREALLNAGAAALLAALLVWFGPPGTDLAAHAYQRALFLHDGFALWNNFWYAGRYSFVTYSLLYYPLAALLGIKLLAVATVATAALAFAVVIGREWGPTARWSGRTFAVIWAGVVLSAAFPFALGVALALLSLWALQASARGRFACLAILTLAASPLAFALLVVTLAGIGIARRTRLSALIVPGATIVVAAIAEFLLWRLFHGGGRYPFSLWSLMGVTTFCLLGAAITWTVETARVLRWMFLAYLAACLFAYFIPSEVGSNILRLRDAAVPVVVLAVSLRRWRPLAICITLVAMAAAWNLTPRVSDFLRNRSDPTAAQAYWRPAIKFLRANLTPAYRVEVVDTAGHWPAVYLPRAGIPLVRGWFRQDDYPANKVLYSRLGPRRYRGWLRRLGVRYVVLARAPTDYSARAEAKLLRTRRAGLVRVLHTRHLAVYELPSPTPIITGPGSHQVLAFHRQSVTVRVGTPGRYRLAVRYSPYLQAKGACVEPGKDAMVRLTAKRAGRIRLNFGISGKRALAALAGQTQECPLRWRPVRVITGR